MLISVDISPALEGIVGRVGAFDPELTLLNHRERKRVNKRGSGQTMAGEVGKQRRLLEKGWNCTVSFICQQNTFKNQFTKNIFNWTLLKIHYFSISWIIQDEVLKY